MPMISRSSGGGLAFSFERCRFDSHLVQSEALVGNDRRPRETWVGSLSRTGFTGNFTVVPTGGWVTRFFPELVDSGYSRSTPFVQWVPRECSGLSLLVVHKKKTQTINMNSKTNKLINWVSSSSPAMRPS
ncbi:hypothetical protein Hanom_Chr06g00540511 [Helianthus anomalus]